MKILVAYDGSVNSAIAIDDLSRAGLPERAEAVVLSAVESPTTQALRSWGSTETDFSPEWLERIDKAETLAEEGANRLRSYFPQWTIQTEASAEHPSESVLKKAKTWSADLIIVGTHGRSAVARVLMGSVSRKLVREAHCSVRVGRATRNDGFLRLIVGTDASPEADAAVDEVCSRVWPRGTQVRVLAIQTLLVPVNSEGLEMTEGLYEKINADEDFRLNHAAIDSAQRLCHAGLVVSHIVDEGDPSEMLVRKATDWIADAIFIGARGVGRLESVLLGSVSSATVAHAPCTVEVVRHP